MARRLITYKSHANTGKWGALYDNIRTQGIGDFEFIALDIQTGKRNAEISEEFFTIYFNRDPTFSEYIIKPSYAPATSSPAGVNLFKNNRYNPIIGDLVPVLTDGEIHPDAYGKRIDYEEVRNWIIDLLYS